MTLKTRKQKPTSAGQRKGKSKAMASPPVHVVKTPLLGSQYPNADTKTTSRVREIVAHVGSSMGKQLLLGLELRFYDETKPVVFGLRYPGTVTVTEKKSFALGKDEGIAEMAVYGIDLTVGKETFHSVAAVELKTTDGRVFVAGGLDRSKLLGTVVGDGYALCGLYGSTGNNIDGIGLILKPGVRAVAIFDVNYDLSDVPIGSPRAVGHMALSNQTDQEQQSSLTVESSVEETSSWSIETGTSLSVMVGTGFEVEAGVPFVGKGTVSASLEVTAEVSFSYSYGRSVTSSEGIQASVSATVPPKSKILATLYVRTAKLDLPYTAKAILFYADGTNSQPFTITGRYKGVSAYDLDVSYDEPVPILSTVSSGKAIRSQSRSSVKSS